MPVRRIEEEHAGRCRHPEHRPPEYLYLEPGLYEHACPGCGETIRFRVGGAIWEARGGSWRESRPLPYVVHRPGAITTPSAW